MVPRIQYAKTKDGVRIAYWTLGNGPTLIYTPFAPVWSHVQLEWQVPELRKWYEALAERVTLVRYDCRGMGLSGRGNLEFSVDTFTDDLKAVIDEFDLDTVALFGVGNTSLAALNYSASNPDRVSHLMLWGSVVSGQRGPTGAVRTTRVLADKDWELYTDTWARTVFGWSGTDQAREWAELRRASSSPEATLAMWEAFDNIDASDLPPQVNVPTLVVAKRSDPHLNLDGVTSLAADIRNARLALFEGAGSTMFFYDDVAAVLAAIDEFLGVQGRAVVSASGPALPSGRTAILFLDIADSTALPTKLGDDAYREKERDLDASLRTSITEAGGTPVDGKVLGDGVMAVFTSARQAIGAAQRCRDAGNEAGLPLHLGIHAGDVVREGNNVHGGAVQLASRVQGVAAPGEILLSATVRDLARTSAGVAFEDRGKHELKGIEDPVRLYEVRWRGPQPG